MKIRRRKNNYHDRLLDWLEPHIVEGRQIKLEEDPDCWLDRGKNLYHYFSFMKESQSILERQRRIRARILKFLPHHGEFPVPNYMEEIMITVLGKARPKGPSRKDYVDWCKENITGYWTVSDAPLVGSWVTVAFGRAEDLLMFKLAFA